MAEHDSPEWRDERDERLHEWVGDRAAVAWLLDFFDACELFDDLIDKDKPISDERVIRALWEVMVDMPGNPFFLRNAHRLIPIVSMGINAWLDANDMEGDGTEHDLHAAYVMRGAYGAITQTVIEIVRGREVMRACSLEIVRFFGAETFEEYAEKIRGPANG